MKDELQRRLDDAKKNERHRNAKETSYWCAQYKLLAGDAVATLSATPTPSGEVEAVEVVAVAEGEGGLPDRCWRGLKWAPGMDPMDVPANSDLMTVAQHQRIVAAKDAEIARLRKLSVTNLMLDVVPGCDGAGVEIYAQSVGDVEKKFGQLVDEIEALETERDALRAQLAEKDKRLRQEQAYVSELAEEHTQLEARLAQLAAQQAAVPVVPLQDSRKGWAYIAGPMTGIPEYNFPAFNAAADELRGKGYRVINPADHGLVDGADWADYLRYDLAKLAACEMMFLLPGWSNSRGVQLELSVATALDMPVRYLDGAEAAPAASQQGELEELRKDAGRWRATQVQRQQGGVA